MLLDFGNPSLSNENLIIDNNENFVVMNEMKGWENQSAWIKWSKLLMAQVMGVGAKSMRCLNSPNNVYIERVLYFFSRVCKWLARSKIRGTNCLVFRLRTEN